MRQRTQQLLSAFLWQLVKKEEIMELKWKFGHFTRSTTCGGRRCLMVRRRWSRGSGRHYMSVLWKARGSSGCLPISKSVYKDSHGKWPQKSVSLVRRPATSPPPFSQPYHAMRCATPEQAAKLLAIARPIFLPSIRLPIFAENHAWTKPRSRQSQVKSPNLSIQRNTLLRPMTQKRHLYMPNRKSTFFQTTAQNLRCSLEVTIRESQWTQTQFVSLYRK